MHSRTTFSPYFSIGNRLKYRVDMADLGISEVATIGQKRKQPAPLDDGTPRVNYGLYWGQSMAQVAAGIDPKWTMPPAFKRVKLTDQRCGGPDNIPRNRGRRPKTALPGKTPTIPKQPTSEQTSIDRNELTNGDESIPPRRKRGRPPKNTVPGKQSTTPKQPTSGDTFIPQDASTNQGSGKLPRKRGRPSKATVPGKPSITSNQLISEDIFIDQNAFTNGDPGKLPRKRGRPPKDARRLAATNEQSPTHAQFKSEMGLPVKKQSVVIQQSDDNPGTPLGSDHPARRSVLFK